VASNHQWYNRGDKAKQKDNSHNNKETTKTNPTKQNKPATNKPKQTNTKTTKPFCESKWAQSHSDLMESKFLQ